MISDKSEHVLKFVAESYPIKNPSGIYLTEWNMPHNIDTSMLME